MSALVRKFSARRNVSSEEPRTDVLRGFGPNIETDSGSRDQLGSAALTMLLVLCPAMASVAVVLAAFMLSGAGTAI
jgi:hypothetical protein